MLEFDDARLDDAAALAAYDEPLRHLAGAGARIRIEANTVRRPSGLDVISPRGLVVLGEEARLIRAVLERACPVPLVAWAFGALPGWVGPLDLVVVLASRDESAQVHSSVVEAARRGAMLIVAAPEQSAVAAAAPASAIQVVTQTGDPTAAAIVALQILHEAHLGPVVNAETVADAADMVAEVSSPHRNLSTNPAKDLALGLAEAEPLVWGGSVLAARASRRVAEAIRVYSGRPALAAEAEDLLPVLLNCPVHDVFEDPFDETVATRPTLVLLDDETNDPQIGFQRRQLTDVANARRVRICEVNAGEGTQVDRYVTLLQQGLYGATYLGLGLDSHPMAAQD